SPLPGPRGIRADRGCLRVRSLTRSSQRRATFMAFRALRDLFGRSEPSKRAEAKAAEPPQASLELVRPAPEPPRTPEPPAPEPTPSLELDIAEGDQQGARERPVVRAVRKPAEASDSYTAADIEVLEGLEPVRRRPGMYVGGTDEKALHHLFAEVIDNSMD